MIQQKLMQHTFTNVIAVDYDAIVMERYQQEKPWGVATSIDLQGCNPNFIRSAELIRSFVNALCQLIEVKKFGSPVVVDFGEDPQVSGYSTTQLIEKALISAHFAIQSNATYIDIFSCKIYPPYMAAAFAKEFFEAQEVRVSINFRY
jgi:S-adenosylmethionine/arginine decarboxylase-like enzyme